MPNIKKISSSNRGPGKGNDRYVVYSKQFNDLVEKLDEGTVEVTTGITASTTSDQTGAVALTAEYNEIATCATAGDSVRLPSAEKGARVVVINRGATAADVFPGGGDAINDLSADAALSVGVECVVEFVCLDGTTWQSNNEAITVVGDVNVGGDLILTGSVTGPAASETVAATNVITAAESGTTFFLSSATEFVSTLPAPAAGLNYKFIIAAAPSGASYTVVTNASANIIIGGVNELEVDTADDGPYIADGDTVTFVDGVSVVGDWVEVISDGTSWFLTGQANADGGITLTQVS